MTTATVATEVGRTEDNSHAGQGAVAVDIGGDYGALVIHTSSDMAGVEIEIRPTGDTPYVDELVSAARHQHEGHEHSHLRGDRNGHSDGDDHRLLHVAVLGRPSPTAEGLFAAVFGSLHRGTYELYRRPAEPVALAVTIDGGSVTEVRWPTDH